MTPRRYPLARRRKACGYSQERLADQVGVDRSTVVRWEAGETEPRPWHRRRIAKALSISLDELDGLLVPESSSDEGDRLSHVFANPARVDLVSVASLRTHIRALDETYDKVPSAALLPAAGQCLGQAACLGEHATGRVRRELYAVEAEAATLMGQLVWDASQRRDHATARAYFDRAVLAARQLHDPAAEGLATLRKTFVALYGEHDPRAGLALAEHAASITGDTSHVLAGLAVLHRAEAHAMLGDRRRCEEALGEAESRFGRIETLDVAYDLYSPTQLGRLAGSCYLFLDDARRAQPILEDTARTLRNRSKSQAIALGNLSLAYLRQGKLDEAVAALHQAIDVVQSTWGGGGLTVVFRIGRELRPWQHVHATQEAYDRLLSLMAP